MARGTLQVAAHAAAAIDANTDLLLANQYYPIAGPCKGHHGYAAAYRCTMCAYC